MMHFPKTALKLALALFMAQVLAGCGKSPEAAAQEICACMSKTSSSQDMGAMAGNAAECEELTAKYRGKYSGEDLNTFTRTLTNCTLGKMGMRQ